MRGCCVVLELLTDLQTFLAFWSSFGWSSGLHCTVCFAQKITCPVCCVSDRRSALHVLLLVKQLQSWNITVVYYLRLALFCIMHFTENICFSDCGSGSFCNWIYFRHSGNCICTFSISSRNIGINHNDTRPATAFECVTVNIFTSRWIYDMVIEKKCFRRPHKNLEEPKSTTRFVWELWHKISGRIALLLGLINITLGIFLALAAFEIQILWYIYLIILLIMYIVFEILRYLKTTKQVELAPSQEMK